MEFIRTTGTVRDVSFTVEVASFYELNVSSVSDGGPFGMTVDFSFGGDNGPSTAYFVMILNSYDAFFNQREETRITIPGFVLASLASTTWRRLHMSE